MPQVKLKIDSPVSDFGFGGKGFAKWTHSSIQNEMIEILSSHCLTKIIKGVKSEENNHYFFRGKNLSCVQIVQAEIKQFSVSVSNLDC